MRNSIQVVDKNVPKVTITMLDIGQMFRYPKGSNDQNVYMVVNNGSGVVLLATGAYYTDFDRVREIEVIDAIKISR